VGAPAAVSLRAAAGAVTDHAAALEKGFFGEREAPADNDDSVPRMHASVALIIRELNFARGGQFYEQMRNAPFVAAAHALDFRA
jgi:hypothetical protein